MIEYFTYYQLHQLDGSILTGLTEAEAEKHRNTGLKSDEYLLGPFIGQRLKADNKDEKEKEQA